MSDTTDREAQIVGLAVRKGWITPAQVEEARRVRQHLAGEGIQDFVLDILCRMRHLSDAHLKALRKELGLPVVQLGDYEIIGRVGRGGMGTVYKALRRSTGQMVALKVIPPATAANADTAARLQHEARAAAALSHPNIVRAYDTGAVNGIYYFAMEFVEGETLASILRRVGRIAEAQAVEIALAVASALQHIHQRGMIHRDVKPSNIMITVGGEIKLCDLGLAKAMEGDATLTQAGIVIGSPIYMSPEQTQGDPDLDGRTDLYSLGATLVHAVTGALPSDRMHRETIDGISPSFQAILKKLTARHARLRYPTADIVMEDLQRLKQGQPIHAVDFEFTPSEKSRVVRVRAPRRRARSSSGVGVFLALGGAAAVVAIVLFTSQPRATPPRETPAVTAVTRKPEPVSRPERETKPVETRPRIVEKKLEPTPEPVVEKPAPAAEVQRPTEPPPEPVKEAKVEKHEEDNRAALAMVRETRAKESWDLAEQAMKDKRYQEVQTRIREFQDQFAGTAVHDSVRNEIPKRLDQAEKGIRQQREQETEKRYYEAVRSNADPVKGIEILEAMLTDAADTQFVQRGQKRIDAALGKLYVRALMTGSVTLKSDVNATVQAGADSSLIMANSVEIPTADLVLLMNGEIPPSTAMKIFRPLLQGADYQRASLRGILKGRAIDLSGQVSFSGVANKAGEFSVTVTLQGRVEFSGGKISSFKLQSSDSKMSTFIGRPGTATISITFE